MADTSYMSLISKYRIQGVIKSLNKWFGCPSENMKLHMYYVACTFKSREEKDEWVAKSWEFDFRFVSMDASNNRSKKNR